MSYPFTVNVHIFYIFNDAYSIGDDEYFCLALFLFD
jgi:hypothetical protein